MEMECLTGATQQYNFPSRDMLVTQKWGLAKIKRSLSVDLLDS